MLFFSYLYEGRAPNMSEMFPTVKRFVDKLEPLEQGHLGKVLRGAWGQQPDAEVDKDMDADTRFRFWLLQRGKQHNDKWSYMQHFMTLFCPGNIPLESCY